MSLGADARVATSFLGAPNEEAREKLVLAADLIADDDSVETSSASATVPTDPTAAWHIVGRGILPICTPGTVGVAEMPKGGRMQMGGIGFHIEGWRRSPLRAV